MRIGSSIYTAELFTTAVIDVLSRRYPRIVFHLITSDEPDTLHRELSERKVDLLIARNGGRLSNEKLEFETLYDPSLVVLGGAGSPWAQKRRISLAELVGEPWVLPPPESVMGSAYLDVFRANGLEYPRIAVFAAQPGARMNLVAAGRFLSLQTSDLRLSRNFNIKVLPVKLKPAHAPVGVVTLKNRALNTAAKLFIETAREVAKPLSRKKW